MGLLGFSLYDAIRGNYLYLTFTLFFFGVALMELFHLLPIRYFKDPYHRDFIAGIVSCASIFVLDFGLLFLMLFNWEQGKADMPSILIYGLGTLSYLILYLYSVWDKPYGKGMANYYLCAFIYALDAFITSLLYFYKVPFTSLGVFITMLTFNASLTIVTVLFTASSIVRGAIKRESKVSERFSLAIQALNKAGIFFYFGTSFSLTLGIIYYIGAFQENTLVSVGHAFVGMSIIRLITYFWRLKVSHMKDEDKRLHSQYQIMLFNAIGVSVLLGAFGTTLTVFAELHKGGAPFSWAIFVSGSFFIYRLIASILDLVHAKRDSDPATISLCYTGYLLTVTTLYTVLLNALSYWRNETAYVWIATIVLGGVAAIFIVTTVKLYIVAIRGLRNRGIADKKDIQE